MKNSKNLLKSLMALSSIVLMGVSSCDRHPIPQIEQCIIGEGVLLCHDPRIGEDPYEISLEEAVKHIATNPDDYKTMKKWMNSKIKRLIQCEDQ